MTINIYDDEFDVKDILKEAIDKGASDIFFVAGFLWLVRPMPLRSMDRLLKKEPSA